MQIFDLVVIGGGINGTAVARDAAGRGLKVLLVEKDDIAQHTSSASSKLIHGGLRYLEYYEFRLVREALRERSVLLRTAPHIVRPLRFLLPHGEGMRPWWMVRAGLRLYDLLAWGSRLPFSRTLAGATARAPLKDGGWHIAAYWDAWVDDARLSVLNAVDAERRGGTIATRTAFISGHRQGDVWRAGLSDGRIVGARAIVNAAGPWVADVLRLRLKETSESKVRLVKGSHIVLPSLFDGEDAFILQQPDGRVVFAIPYQGRFTLLGTTDIAVDSPDDSAATDEEVRYLCDAANLYFAREARPEDVVWRYSGIRALHDDGAAEAKAVTRDYHLELDLDPGPQLLSVFGGKITTARALAEEVLEKLGFGAGRWTSKAPLPGGDFPDFERFVGEFQASHSWLPPSLALRLVRAYGREAGRAVAGAESIDGLGRHFGAGLYEAEVRHLIAHEFALTAEDIVWRRTKLGLHMGDAEQAALAEWMQAET